jgi:hypothetical protein
LVPGSVVKEGLLPNSGVEEASGVVKKRGSAEASIFIPDFQQLLSGPEQIGPGK